MFRFFLGEAKLLNFFPHLNVDISFKLILKTVCQTKFLGGICSDLQATSLPTWNSKFLKAFPQLIC